MNFPAVIEDSDSVGGDGSSDEGVREEAEVETQVTDTEIDGGEDGPPEQLAEQEEAPKKKKKFMRSGKCLNCKEKGHLKMECPKLTEERRTELQVRHNSDFLYSRNRNIYYPPDFTA